MGREWRACCAAHDAAYEAGTGIVASHLDLWRCVAEVNWAMATVMLAGLMTLGWGYIVHRNNRPDTGRDPGPGRR